MARPKLLYLYPRSSVFIQRDIDLLARHFDVHAHELLTGADALLPWRLLVQLVFLIRHAAWKHDAVCHFSGYHSIWTVLLAKRCFIILAGSDGASFPGMRYGNFRKPLYAWATGFSVRRATRLLPVDATLIEAEQSYDPSSPKHQGVKSFVPGLRTPWTTIPYGFDPERWSAIAGEARDEQLFVCVAGGALHGNAVHFRKGIDLILACAPSFPQARFVVVGSPDPGSYTALPDNVRIEGKRTGDELRRIFSGARFYMQVSVMEGFPNALCEAMLSGCVPIVSSMAAMPTIAGATGFISTRRDASTLASVLQRALDLSPQEREARSAAAVQRILANYRTEVREAALLRELESG